MSVKMSNESSAISSSSSCLSKTDDILNPLYKRPCKPQTSRPATVQAIHALMGTLPESDSQEQDSSKQAPPPRPPLSNVFGPGPLFISDLHESTTLQDGVIVGIDEAGRGSVFGPMIYGAAFWNPKVLQKIPKDLNDSKQLTGDVRAKLLGRILETHEMGFGVRVLHACEISRNMLRPEPYNLNQMSHDAAMEIIRELLDAGVKIATCYIDTVGIADHYQRKLQREFPGLDFVVESKADAKYPCCSAASVVAKVVRDRMLENWTFSEPALQASTHFGSGYPSDPVCQNWMQDNLGCKIFGYPDMVRFSWGPTKKLLDEHATKVTFAADVDEEDAETIGVKRQQEQMNAFLQRQDTSRKRKRLPFFQRKRLEAVTKLF